MNRPIRQLGDLERVGGGVEVDCRRCRRTALFAVGELLAHFRRRGWDGEWPNGIAVKLRCEACGSRFPRLAWFADAPPAARDDPRPPRLRAVTSLAVPLGVDPVEWEKAATDRDRKLLIRRARD